MILIKFYIGLKSLNIYQEKGLLFVEHCNNFYHLLSSVFVLSSTNLYLDNAL